MLRGEILVPAGEGLRIVRALPHGHVSAALGTARRIGLDRLLPCPPERRRKLTLALIVARLIDPVVKLATARALEKVSAMTTAEYFAERKARANIEAFARIVNRTGGEPSRPDDELPE